MAPGYNLLFAFDNVQTGPGAYPSGGVLQTKRFGIVGTTSQGGTSDQGTLFQLTPTGSGYVETAFSFACSIAGCGPGGPATEEQDGTVFTQTGSSYGGVAVLTPGPNGYRETAHYEFPQSDDNGPPVGRIAIRGKTAYVVTSSLDSFYGLGEIWAFSIPALAPTKLFTFTKAGGYFPTAGLVLGADGALYGTTYAGGTFGLGTVFQFIPNGKGGTMTTLYNFEGGNDGAMPNSSLVIDPAGNLYGTTAAGGHNGNVGTVFKLTRESDSYQEAVLYSFTGRADGYYPDSLVLNGDTLWGAAGLGGIYECSCGTLFSISTAGSSFVVLHEFAGPDGAEPNGALVFRGGVLYGSTGEGGPSSTSAGVVFAFDARR